MDENWQKLSPEEKRKERFKKWLSSHGVQFVSPEAENLYKQRVNRLIDVIHLKEPDRVPVSLLVSFVPAYYSGLTSETVMYDYEKLRYAWLKFSKELEPDTFFTPAIPHGGMLEILDYKVFKWPGHGLPANSMHQWVEGEYMKADEYDHFIQDPSDYWIRVYLPRICGALEPLKMLPHLMNIGEVLEFAFSVPFATPEVQAALQALNKAGQDTLQYLGAIMKLFQEVQSLGIPLPSGAMSMAPFDVIGDEMRGSRGVMMDMYRQPDKLLEAIEKVTAWMIERGIAGANLSGIPVVFMPLHKGADGFMSEKQFTTFYWPSFKKVILSLINEGLVPWLFAEGRYDSRLEIIKELPKGKVIWHFDLTDMARAKEVLGDTACIKGNIPTSLLITGTPSDVKDHCKKLIEVAGRGGGYILAEGAEANNAKPENIRAVIEAAKEYGVYKK